MRTSDDAPTGHELLDFVSFSFSFSFSFAPVSAPLTFGGNFMQISHDAAAHTKIAILYVFGLFLIGLIAIGVFHGDSYALIIAAWICAAPLFYRCYKKRIIALATNVFIERGSMFCTISGQELQIPKDRISGIEDSGYTRAPHLIIVSLHDGREIEFFPSRDFGGFGSLRLKKRLKEWLVSSEFQCPKPNPVPGSD